MGLQLHHRHYGTWGAERPEDVMLLCDPCHAFISGTRNSCFVHPDSLGGQGDNGGGMNPLWWAWLRGCGQRLRSFFREQA